MENESAISRAIDRVWLRKDADGWYFTTPDAMRWNRDVTEPADARPLEYWLSRRKTVTESFQKQILSLMGPAKESDYETAYSVYTWITQNITYSQNNVVANSQWVLDNRVAKCDGYSTLMVDALAVYGIPARIAVGQRITHFDKFGTFVDIFDLNHAWVEFYDSRSDRWVIVDPTWGCNVPECQFDIDRTNAANVMKIAYYE